MTAALSNLSMPAIDMLAPRQQPRVTAASADQASKVGQEFEQMFLAQMLSPVFEALRSDGPFGGGAGERMFRTFQVNEYARAVTRAGGLGIAEAVAREIIALQEKANG